MKLIIFHLAGYNTVWFAKWVPKFRSNTWLQSFTLKMEVAVLSEMLVLIYQAARRHIQ